MTTTRMKHAANTSAWALGKPAHNGFHVRRVVWGYLLAKEECRPGEQIRAAKIWVESEYNPRRTLKKIVDELDKPDPPHPEDIAF
jgi:hypothetical protein